VEVAAQGARRLNLTWVEREVAAIILYARGIAPQEIRLRLGFEVSKSRWQKIRDLIGDRNVA
jgi:hypothetical protein